MPDLKPSDPRHSNHLIYTNGLRARRPLRTKLLLSQTRADLLALCMNSDKEVCGFITVQEEIHLVENVHSEPRFNYYMDRDSLAQVVKQIYQVDNDKILGIFHTHPNNQPWPSPRDIAGWPNSELNWAYWIVTNKEVIEWELFRP